MSSNNPAARLLNILEKGGELPPDMNTRKAWRQLLGVKPKEKSELMARIGKVMALPAEIRISLNNIKGVQVERYTHYETALDNAFSQNNLEGAWQNVYQHIDGHVINYLSNTSDILSLAFPEPVLDKPTLNTILANTASLIDEIKRSDIPTDIKSFMILQLHRICLAVDEYEINGAQSISIAVQSAFGYGVLHGESVELVKTNNVAKRFWQHMANIALVVSIAAGVQQLTAPIMKLLPDIDFTETLHNLDSDTSMEIEDASVVE